MVPQFAWQAAAPAMPRLRLMLEDQAAALLDVLAVPTEGEPAS
jgi:hypothetical protein